MKNFRRGVRGTLLMHGPTWGTWRGWATDIPAAMARRGWQPDECIFRYPDERVWRFVTSRKKVA